MNGFSLTLAAIVRDLDPGAMVSVGETDLAIDCVIDRTELDRIYSTEVYAHIWDHAIGWFRTHIEDHAAAILAATRAHGAEGFLDEIRAIEVSGSLVNPTEGPH